METKRAQGQQEQLAIVGNPAVHNFNLLIRYPSLRK